MKSFLTGAFAAVAALVLVPAGAQAAPCKDSHGKFVKCPTATPKAATMTNAEAKPAKVTKAAKVKATKAVSSKTAKGHCRDAHGRFAKCGAPGSKPA